MGVLSSEAQCRALYFALSPTGRVHVQPLPNECSPAPSAEGLGGGSMQAQMQPHRRSCPPSESPPCNQLHSFLFLFLFPMFPPPSHTYTNIIVSHQSCKSVIPPESPAPIGPPLLKLCFRQRDRRLLGRF